MIRDDFLPLARPHISQKEVDAVSEVVRSGWWTTGPKVFEFEKLLSEYISKTPPMYVAGLNSCTSALFLALKALNITAGDEVIIPTWTFAATCQVIEWIGAKPILCDIERESLNIDLTKIKKLITPRTKAIIPVHMAGYPCDMNQLKNIADRHNLKVIEDAAHALGTKYNGIKIGGFSDVTCFSFYATKNLAMGEGGAAISRDKSLVERIAKLAYFGINKEAHKRYEKAGNWFYDIEELGYKCNLDSLHAALGIVQLKKLDSLNERRREIAKIYKNKLHDSISFSADSEKHYHSYHLFPIFLPLHIDRDSFIQGLKTRNIGASVHFIPLHLHSRYRKKFKIDDFPVANETFKSVVSIPMFPSMSDEDVHYVIHHINQIVRGD